MRPLADDKAQGPQHPDAPNISVDRHQVQVYLGDALVPPLTTRKRLTRPAATPLDRCHPGVGHDPTMPGGPALSSARARALEAGRSPGIIAPMPPHILIDDITPRIAYVATSGQTVFQVPFAFFSDADLVVYVNAVLRTLTTHYTVAGAGNSELASRKVTFVSGLTVGDAVVIIRDIPIERTTDFPNSGPVQISSLNTQFDRIIAIQQQLEDSIARTLRLADSDPVDNLILPAVADRASKYLFFDADGNPMAAAAVTSSAAVAAFWVAVLQTENAAAARSALGIAELTSYVALANWHHCR